MVTQRIAAVYIQALSIGIFVYALGYLFKIYDATFHSTAEWYAFGILFILPFAVAAAAGGFGLVIVTSVLYMGLIKGESVARFAALAVISTTIPMYFPFGLIVAVVPLLGLTIGWRKDLLEIEKANLAAAAIALKSREVYSGRADEPKGEGSLCQNCGIRFEMDVKSERPWLCSECK